MAVVNGTGRLGGMHGLARAALIATAAVTAGTATTSRAWADPTLTSLSAFAGANGIDPFSGITVDAAGNLYGTTEYGGSSYDTSGFNGYGTVFELSGPNHQTLTTVASFDGANGYAPLAGLTADAAGNLYGTTTRGGAAGTSNGKGTIFELSGPTHQTLTALASFDNDANGGTPLGNLVFDAAGNLYGTTSTGGAGGVGTVFELSADHATFTTLVAFNGTNGATPAAGLTVDAAGNLYGTTKGGGSGGFGTVFELSGPNHTTLTTLARFNGPGTGSAPEGPVSFDAAGNLYGTTSGGGSTGGGTVYELSGTSHSTLQTLTTMPFADYEPAGNLSVDAVGNLYGVSPLGGTNERGSVFELSGPNHSTLTTVASFEPSVNASHGTSGLTVDAAGNLYGTSWEFGPAAAPYGNVYELTGSGFVVPEPASAGLLTATLAGSVARRRRRR